MAFFDDKQDETTLALIRRRFANPESFRVFNVNIVKKIVSRRATAYQTPPVRTFGGWDQAAAAALYQEANIDAVMKRASKLTKLHKTTALQVVWTEDRGLQVRVHTPNILDAEWIDPEHPSRIVVTHSASDPAKTTYADWSASTYQRRNFNGHPVPVPGNANGVNPYGILPFVPLFDRLPDADFFLPGGDDLMGAQKALNVGLTNLWRAVELQSHGQAVAKGLPIGDPIATGPDKVILLPKDGEFSYAAPNTPIPDILEALEFLMRSTAATNDCTADVLDLSKTAESGSAREAQRIDLKEARLDDIALWRGYERRLFEVIKRVINTHRPGTIPETASVRADFTELQDNLTESEVLANLKERAELGISSPVDALMTLNPDGYTTREDAYRALMTRKQETQELLLAL
ncbi:MAG: hypothetical protein ACK4MH_04095 [Brevundimonas sp.]|uniref:hypothetical protein n=1 Tax=Brevundimonas sp. TaxID=1871086 RepID=UPI00391AE9ED